MKSNLLSIFFSASLLLFIAVCPAVAQDTTKKTITRPPLETIRLKDSKKVDDLKNSSPTRYYMEEGKKKSLKGDFSEAIYNFSTALFYDSTNADAYFNRGTCKYYFQDYTNAIIDLSKAISFDSTRENYYDQRGICYTYQNNYAAAKKDFEKALKLKPDSPDANLNMGVMYLSTENYDTACDYLHKAQKAGSDKAQKAIDVYCRSSK